MTPVLLAAGVDPVDWIFSHLQIVAAIGAAAFIWFKSVLAKAAEKRAEARAEQRRLRGDDVDVRRTVEPPPIPPAPRSASATRRSQDIAATLHRNSVAAGSRVLAPPPAPPAKPSATPAKKPKRPKLAETTVPTVKQRLRSRREVRRAIVLQEILGPPVSLRTRG